MTRIDERIDVRAMRQAFDANFARGQTVAKETPLSLLGIRVDGQSWVLPLAEIASIHVLRRWIRVPSRTPHLLGLVGVRGVSVPVYDLAALVGRPATSRPGWFALSLAPRAAESIGLAFESVETHWKTSAKVLSELVETPAGLRPVIHLASILEAINRSTAEVRPSGSSD